MFALIDKNGDKMITFYELKRGLDRLGKEETLNDLQVCDAMGRGTSPETPEAPPRRGVARNIGVGTSGKIGKRANTKRLWTTHPHKSLRRKGQHMFPHMCWANFPQTLLLLTCLCRVFR